MTTTEHHVSPIEGADAALEHLNGNHADTVLFLGSHLAGGPLLDAELVRADADGVDIAVRDHAGRRTLRVPFAEPVADAGALHVQLLARLAEARAAAPDAPLTSTERELAGQATIPTRTVTVTAVHDVAPGLRELTFGGLDGHHPLGPDDFFLVIRPQPGDESFLDRDDVQFRELRDLPPERTPDWAYYTCRRWHAETAELDAWFVLHEHDGPISGWARRAEAGDRVLLWGPRSAYEPPAGTSHVLLVGDETGLGAFAAVLEAAPPDIAITVLVESDHGEPVVALPDRPGADVRWLSRRGLERGTGTQLVDAVAALDLDVAGLYAYGAGESRLVTAVRTHLRHERGVPGPQVQMVGYWRRDA